MNDVPRRKMTAPSEPDLLQSLTGSTPAMQPDPPARPRPGRTGPFGVLDIGSSKICCLIGRVEQDGGLRVIGSGVQASRGVRAGSIVDLEAAYHAIQRTVAEAEEKSAQHLHRVCVNLTCGQPESRVFELPVPVDGRAVTEADIRKALAAAHREWDVHGRTIVHALPLVFAVDETRGVADPRGMRCDTLFATVHLIGAASLAIQNLEITLERCELAAETLVSAPLASALATLVEDERQLGATVIDMGGGTTGMAVFSEGQLRHVAHLPVGGGHVTNDIARVLSTPVADAERLKTLYGNAQASPDDDREMLTIPLVGEEEHSFHKIPRAEVVRIIKPRLEETFELVKARLDAAELTREAGNRVVLTGGASQLSGAREMAAHILNRQVRLGRPAHVRGLPDYASGPGFSTACGLLAWASGAGRTFADIEAVDEGPPTWLRRIVKFVKERV